MILAVLRVSIGYVAFPLGLLPAASFLFTVVFLVLPILALFVGGAHPWDIRQAIAVVVLGVVVQVGGTTLAGMAQSPSAGGMLYAVAQTGLVVWCMGVGAALACLIKDRNMLLPIAVFLALFDMWLVFAPEGMVNTALKTGQAPIKLESVALGIPQIASTVAAPTHGYAQNRAYVGPADLLFLGMFFAALFRYRMRPRQTLLAIVPVLVAYLAVVLLYGDVFVGPIRLGALPALLPIGLTVLWVNRREFKLVRDEKIITLGLLILGIPFVAWRIAVTQPEPDAPPTPAPTGPSQWSVPFQPSERELTGQYQF